MSNINDQSGIAERIEEEDKMSDDDLPHEQKKKSLANFMN